MRGNVLLLLLVFVIFTGCIHQESPESIAMNATQVQSFLLEHPDAGVSTIDINEDFMRENLNSIIDRCGVEMPVAGYTRVTLSEGESQLTVYVNRETNALYICNATVKATYIPAQTTTPSITETTAPTAAPPAEPRVYLIKIDDSLFLPIEDKEIHIGDTVIWRNLEDWRRPHNLINENGIWDSPQNLPYLRSIAYTFNETGTYTFYLQDYEKRKMVIHVT